MAELQGLNGIDRQPQLTKPIKQAGMFQGLKSKLFKDSVMEPGFIESLTAPEGSPIDYNNISSVSGGRIREMVVDPVRRYAGSIHKGMTGEQLTIADQLNLIEGMIDTSIGGLFRHSASKGFKGFDPNTLHMFVGPKAKDIVKAESMVRKGASPAEIQSKLLMHKKPDGMWRKEISDVGMELDPSKLEVKYPAYPDFEQARLGDVVRHESLYSESPGLEDLSFQLRQDGPASIERGSFSGNALNVNQDSPARRIVQANRTAGSYTDEFIDKMAKELVEDGDAPDYATAKQWMEVSRDKQIAKASGIEKFEPHVKGTIGHELQHAVQQKEGWARGGSPDEFARKKVALEGRVNSFNQDLSSFAKKIDESKDAGDKFAADYYKKLYDETMAAKMDLVDDIQADPFKQYQNLLGEREARDTASRLGLDLEQRRELLPDVGEGAQVLMR